MRDWLAFTFLGSRIGPLNRWASARCATWFHLEEVQ